MQTAILIRNTFEIGNNKHILKSDQGMEFVPQFPSQLLLLYCPLSVSSR